MDAYTEIFGTTERALRLRSTRMATISSNLANADVQGYKSRDIDFKKIMADEASEKMTTTNTLHISGSDPRSPKYLYRVPINPSENGNTVEMNYEQAQFGSEATRYTATLQFLESRVGGIRRALRGE